MNPVPEAIVGDVVAIEVNNSASSTPDATATLTKPPAEVKIPQPCTQGFAVFSLQSKTKVEAVKKVGFFGTSNE